MKYFLSMLFASFALVPLVGSAKAADYQSAVPSETDTFSGIYLRGDAGASFLNWSSANDNSTFIGDAGIGYRFDQNLRADITYNWTGDYSIVPGATLRTSTVLGNIYYDWKNESAFVPYIGAGVGYGWQYGAGGQPNGEGIAVGLNAGVAYEMTNNLAVDVGYRFHDILDGGQNTPEHQVAAGLRVQF